MPKLVALLTIWTLFVAGCAMATSIVPTQPVEQPTTATGVTNRAVVATATPQAQSKTAAPSKPSPTAPRAQSGAGSTPTVAPAIPKSTVPAPAAFTLNVTSPQDETTVNVASITVVGQTAAGAVVSVNGDLVDVDAAGRFQATVALDEGPNIIEIVASSQTGNELGTVLRVIYEP